MNMVQKRSDYFNSVLGILPSVIIASTSLCSVVSFFGTHHIPALRCLFHTFKASIQSFAIFLLYATIFSWLEKHEFERVILKFNGLESISFAHEAVDRNAEAHDAEGF